MSLAIIALALSAQAADQQSYCVLQGDKLVPTGEVIATGMAWYADGQQLVLGKKRYIKYGFPQIMGPDDLQYWQSKDSVPVMIKAGGTYKDIIYVPSSTTLCEFQPYRVVETVAKKR
jgi:hypothetical protein